MKPRKEWQCKCGCKGTLPFHRVAFIPGHHANKKSYCKVCKMEKSSYLPRVCASCNKYQPCDCGCGAFFLEYDTYGRTRRFPSSLHSHKIKSKKTKLRILGISNWKLETKKFDNLKSPYPSSRDISRIMLETYNETVSDSYVNKSLGKRRRARRTVRTASLLAGVSLIMRKANKKGSRANIPKCIRCKKTISQYDDLKDPKICKPCRRTMQWGGR